MLKPIIRLKWRSSLPYERMEVLMIPLAVFTSASAIAAGLDRGYQLAVSIAFCLCLALLIRNRASRIKSNTFAGLAFGLLFVFVPQVELYCFLFILYPLLLLYALIEPNPRISFTAGLFSSFFLLRFQGHLESAVLWANMLAVPLNALVYSLLAHIIRRLLKERNEYRHLSMIDSLTGLHSLQQTLLFGQKLLDAGRRVRVLLIDLDHFKQINDTYGHMVGNQVIVHFAGALKKLTEGLNGVVGRLGGDEFVLVVEDRARTEELLDKIEERLNRSRYIPERGGDPLLFTFSIGEAVSTGHTKDMEQLMHLADLHMYERKLRNRAPLTLNQSEQLFEHHPDPICTFDSQGTLLDMNPAAEELLGYKAEEIKELTFTSIICPTEQAKALEHYMTYTVKGSPTDYDVTVMTGNGKQVPVHVMNISIIVNHKIAGFYALAKDQSRIKLEEERQREADKLNAMSRTAVKFTEELQGPLNALYEVVEQLMEQDAERTPLYGVMRRELEYLALLLEGGTLPTKPMGPLELHSPATLVAQVVRLLEPKAFIADVHWEIRSDTDMPDILCDASRIKLMLLHLMTNALEATPPGGCVLIDLVQEMDAVVIRIRDQGGPLDDEALGQIGDRFYTTKPNGLGVGLWVSSRIARDHQGSLYVCHDPAEGTTVQIKLPAWQPL